MIASADQFNAVYMGNESSAGKIEIINSRWKQQAIIRFVYRGNLTVNGGEVSCTSTADSAIWTKKAIF